MNTMYTRSRLITNLITAALLTIFITGFGVLANVQVENRASNCALEQTRQHSEEYCNVEQIVAAIDNKKPAMFCQCASAGALASK